MGVIKRSKSKESKHVRLYRYMTESLAYKALSGDAVKVLIEIHMRYNGKNNGRINKPHDPLLRGRRQLASKMQHQRPEYIRGQGWKWEITTQKRSAPE